MSRTRRGFKMKRLHTGFKCGMTGKIQFPSHEAAVERGVELMATFRSYKCEYCGAWHLTKKV